MTLRFGTDGVRGIANRELTVELVTALGRAAVRVLGADAPFVVGRDTRRSGPMLEAALVAGLCAEGADVVLAGVLPTPGVAHLARDRGGPAAVISASHNPLTDNGVKLFAAGGRKIPYELEAQVEHELRELAVSDPGPGPDGPRVGVASERRQPFDEYLEHLVDSLNGRRLDGLQVSVDCGIELVETPVGDRNVVDEMERRNLVLGGEQSGHVIFADHATTGDGTLTGILLLDVMARRRRMLSELASVMTPVPQVLRNVSVADASALNGDSAFWGRVRAAGEELGDKGRVLVRPSGTEPVVRVMVEATDAAEAEAVGDRLVDLVEHAASAPGARL